VNDTLPLLVSVPHVGLWVPPEVRSICCLRHHEILEDGDVAAGEIYWPLESQVAAFVTADVARAIVDLNRAEDDRRADGVVKTHTCWNVPVYRRPLSEDIVRTLLENYYRPYHARLTELASAAVVLGIDAHTMAAAAPPIDAEPGAERPPVCISNGNGRTSPHASLESLAACFENAFGTPVARNDPFSGGYIVRSHAAEIPWVQIEISRAPFLPNAEKAERVQQALHEWCAAQDLG
jgi:N-formylglutamate amidohydrolase